MLDWMEYHSIYIHIPFCVRRCRYCDFSTYAGMQRLIPAYVDALCKEIALVGQSIEPKVPVGTIYFGGGTPSLLNIAQFEKILNTLNQSFDATDVSEITVEANPGTVNESYFSGLFQLGVNRLSLGAQSALPTELELLGRIHTVVEIGQAVEHARRAGFENINLDFIYGLPGQTTTDWQASLDLACALHPEHLSCYGLTLEDETPLAKMIAEGKLPKPDDDQAADCYEMAMDHLDTAGYQQYEISNWAVTRNGELLGSRHNLQYWHNDPYLGFGVGAHGYSNGVRTANGTTIPDYLARMKSDKPETFPCSPTNETRLVIDEENRRQEAMMVGLRLTKEGIARSHYINKYHVDYYDKYKKQIDRLIKQGLLEWVEADRDRIRLTRRGRLLGNQVFMQFVGEDRN
jgi:oxygen-independent coproporphyrinogen-3 oxidase